MGRWGRAGIRGVETTALAFIRPDHDAGRRAAAGLSRAAASGRLWIGLSALGASSRRTRPAAREGLVAWAAASLVALGVKRVAHRRRPRGIAAFGSVPRSSSMPSSHTSGAVAYATAATLVVPVVGPLVWPLAGSVAWSRAATGRHFPSDVLVGAALGGVAGAAVHATMRTRALADGHGEGPAPRPQPTG